MTYLTYLRSATWRSKRIAALERAGQRCQVCNSPDKLQVHHRTYERLGNELPEDLTVLCDDCHTLFSRRTVKWYSWLGSVASEIFDGVRW